ncbi:hypothetical protein [Microbulbifer discodermiae]|uniref:hypothetical protein n=1 Tax=Microbulbifer sp. 2201CG32-9 TaxID=3232309 RepID=UPI00345BE7EE
MVKDLIEKGLRRPGDGTVNGWLNNIESSLPFCPNYYGCGDQSLYLVDQLNDPSFYDSLSTQWRFEIIYEWGTIDHPFPHQWVEGYPWVDESRRIKLDPWANQRSRSSE